MFPIGDLPDSAAEIAAEQLVAVLSMEWLRICKEKVVPFATHSIKLLLVLDPVEHCGLRCQKLGIHRFWILLPCNCTVEHCHQAWFSLPEVGNSSLQQKNEYAQF